MRLSIKQVRLVDEDSETTEDTHDALREQRRRAVAGVAPVEVSSVMSDDTSFLSTSSSDDERDDDLNNRRLLPPPPPPPSLPREEIVHETASQESTDVREPVRRRPASEGASSEAELRATGAAAAVASLVPSTPRGDDSAARADWSRERSASPTMTVDEPPSSAFRDCQSLTGTAVSSPLRIHTPVTLPYSQPVSALATADRRGDSAQGADARASEVEAAAPLPGSAVSRGLVNGPSARAQGVGPVSVTEVSPTSTAASLTSPSLERGSRLSAPTVQSPPAERASAVSARAFVPIVDSDSSSSVPDSPVEVAWPSTGQLGHTTSVDASQGAGLQHAKGLLSALFAHQERRRSRLTVQAAEDMGSWTDGEAKRTVFVQETDTVADAPVAPEEAEVSVETVAVSAPTTANVSISSVGRQLAALSHRESASTVHVAREAPAAAATTPEGTQKRPARHADSTEWASSRQTALDQLRAELAQVVEADSPDAVAARARSRSRSLLSNELSLTGMERATGTTEGHRAPAPADGQTPEQVSQRSAPDESPLSLGRQAGPVDETVTTNVGPNVSGISRISPDKITEVQSILLEHPELLYGSTTNSPASAKHEGVRRHWDSVPASGSPFLSSPTPSGPLSRGLEEEQKSTPRATSPRQRSVTVTPRGKAKAAPGTARTRQAVVGRPTGTGDAAKPPALYHVPGVNSTLLEVQYRKRMALVKEMDAKRMAECTFRPTIDPGTQAMMQARARVESFKQKQQQEHLQLESEDSTLVGNMTAMTLRSEVGGVSPGRRSPSARTGDSSPRLGAIHAPDGVASVYERLYPAELAEAQLHRQQRKQEQAYLDIAREEMQVLRVHLGAVIQTTDQHKRDLITMLSNVLGVDCRQAGRLSGDKEENEESVFLRTAYVSPMSIALKDASSAARKRTGNLTDCSTTPVDRTTNATDSEAGETDLRSSSQQCRAVLFDEFLLRQNAHHVRRTRTIQQLEEHITPEFKPVTNARSDTLLKSMVQRSMLEESTTPEASHLVQQLRSQGVPVNSLLVKKHLSPYVDECTFHPKVSPAAEQARSASAKKRKGGAFQNLYKDSLRQRRLREQAQKQAAEDELDACTFKPVTNVKRNADVESLLAPSRSSEYSRFLRGQQEYAKRQRELELQRLEEEKAKAAQQNDDDSEARTATEDLVDCTFRPRTTKTPAYISKMASSFGIVRRMDVEF